MKLKITTEIIGLLFSFVGTLLLAFAIHVFNPVKDCGQNISATICGNNISLAVQNEFLWWFAVVVLLVGFGLQLWSKLINK